MSTHNLDDTHPNSLSVESPRFEYLPVVPAFGPFPSEDERTYAEAALDARNGNRATRNTLYFAFLPRIERIARGEARRLQAYSGSLAVDIDDVRHEGFLAFIRLIDGWPGGASFSRYFLGHFHWELRNALRSFIRPDTRVSLRRNIAVAGGLRYAHPGPEPDCIDFDRLLPSLGELERNVLQWRFCDECSMTEIARRLGRSRRSAARFWSHVLSQTRKNLRGDANGL